MNNYQPEAIIFDMDGLMIDSEGKQSAAIEKMLREHGEEPVYRPTGIVQIAGMRARDNLAELKKQHNLKPSVSELSKRKNELYREVLLQGVDVMPGLSELMADLAKAPVKKALASSSSISDIQVVLRHLKLETYFDTMVSGQEVAASKPAPDIFLETAKRLDVDPERCVVLEDSGVGVQAAKAAGMAAVAVPNRYTEDHDFDTANLVVSSLTELNWERLKALPD
jgi:beta-phosphoglucomutase family hydrolase